MAKENYNSDLYRTGDTSKYLKNFLYGDKFHLKSGDILDELNISYETYGNLNKMFDLNYHTRRINVIFKRIFN